MAGGLPAPVFDIPVLVSLDSTRVSYAVAGAGGESLEFRDVMGTRLDHEIATWDPLGSSQVWLRLPVLETGTTISMLYGLAAAPVAGSAVWSDHGLVVHLEDGLSDSSPGELSPTLEGGAVAAPGRIGFGAQLDGVDDFIAVGSELPTFSGSAGATLSAWVNTASTGVHPILGFANNTSSSSRAFLALATGLVPRFGVLTSEMGSATEQLDGTAISASQWHWLVGTADLAQKIIAVYIDGELVSQATLSLAADAFPPDNSAVATIGVNDTSPVGFLPGTVDEVRAAPRAVDRGWVSAHYLSMIDQLFVFGAEEPL